MTFEKMSLEQKIDIAWFKKSGQMPGGFQKWKDMYNAPHFQAEIVAVEFGVSFRTVERWSKEYRALAEVK